MSNIEPSPHTSPSEPSRVGVSQMFDKIAHRYDLLNRTLSMGMDQSWRKKVVSRLPARQALRVLDVATGTGDLAIAIGQDPRVASVLGIDLAEEMLARGRIKLVPHRKGAPIELHTGDALDLQSLGQTFDVVTNSFGIRNVLDVDQALREMRAVLRPGGKALVLEFSTPPNPVFRAIYELYRAHILPRVGGLVSGDPGAYQYLDRTNRTVPAGEAFLDKMRSAGFHTTRVHRLSLGAVSLYEGVVAEAS